MYPGATTRLSRRTLASAASIVADVDLLVLTGTTSIDTIVPKTPNVQGMAQVLFILPTGGNVATTTNGNCNAAVTMLDDKISTLVYEPTLAKWFSHALS